ncbi:efflux RND transporter periplasmic adaptor subunit [Pseudodonghicola flavimaris]|uniref:Efflux RND transporter periplasmic adaptor subunit n=1 Tax=Pseudodonghicola flavimaris TaxID=3050036 RepID=A0ABT7F6D4_9RHOB|nr:efflux RND transporter periplasmic adaptor subunit [Pseudodonghicola flavimaris]MDK3020158.1 efflux RND transporter periplasmic adaptor subunit [Pseudodonghicola flavimaris]
MTPKRLTATALAALLALTAPPLRAAEETAAVPQAARPVVTEIVAAEATRLRSFPGVIKAAVETSLAFQTSGRIATRPAELGDVVKAGDVLATLDQITLAEDVAAAQAALKAAQAAADLAAQSLTRVEELNRRGVASTAQLEAAIAERDATAASARAAEADLTSAEDAERYGTLRAPADGVVITVDADPGTTVSSGTSVLTLATEAGREAVIDVPTEVLTILPKDARFTIAPRSPGGAAIPGRLRLIEPVADSSTRSHRLRITILGDAPGLRLGSLVSASLDSPATPVLTLPRRAILDAEGSPRVWRIGAGRKAEPVAVTLGQSLGERVIITTGLQAGDEVLIRGIHSVETGQTLGERIEE